MEIRNILRTGYKVLVVTVTLIEAIDLGKNLIGKCKNKKATTTLDSVAETKALRVLNDKDLDVLINFLEGIATLLKGIKKLQGVIVKLIELREPP